MDIGKLKTNAKAETDGVWMDGPEDSKLLIARWMNAKYKAYVQKNGAALRANRQAGLDVTAESLKLTKVAVANTILLGWKNIALDGAPLEYSPENAEKLFIEVPDFYALVLTLTDDVAKFRDEETAGKLPGSGA